jgi:serine/threonine-protein kinase
MSPEQIAGDRDVDARTDIYSLGCVLYEMLAGDPPFTGATPQVILARHVTDPPPPITTARSSVPAPLAAALGKALGKARADRFDSAQALSEALRTEPMEADPDLKSIAVLPFANLSPDPDNEYFSDGMTEEIINALVHLEDLHVASRSSSFAFKGLSPDIAEVGAKLRVSTVLEGSVRRSGDRLRITAQLIKVADGYHLWSERYDRRMKDVFDIQDDIANAIVEALKVRLLGVDANRLMKRGTQDLEAYHLYLKGWHLWLQRGDGLSKCIPYFEQAIEKDPHYAQPYTGLVGAYCILGFYGLVPSLDAYSKVRTAAERAVALDDGLAEAHYSLGLCEMYYGWNMDSAASKFRRAIKLDPSMALAHVWLSLTYAILGRIPESVAETEHAQELEPISPVINSIAGFAHYFGGRPVHAREAAQRALEIDPTFPTAHWVLGLAATVEAKYEDAVNDFENAALYTHRSPVMLMFLGTAYARSGRETDARDILGELRHESQRGTVYSAFAYQVNFHLGELELAFEQLTRAFEERSNIVWWVAAPGYAWPRSDPRLASLLDRPELNWLNRLTPEG